MYIYIYIYSDDALLLPDSDSTPKSGEEATGKQGFGTCSEDPGQSRVQAQRRDEYPNPFDGQGLVLDRFMAGSGPKARPDQKSGSKLPGRSPGRLRPVFGPFA